MADGDTRGAKDCVEGYDPREKKPLEKVSNSRLPELKKEQKQLEVKVKKELESEQKRLMDLQNKLNDCNKEYADRKRELDELRAVQIQKLTPTQQTQIRRVTNRIVDSFLQRRPRNEPDGEEKTVDVDVHYLPSMEAGLSLRIGGEGAGSRDAKFPVKLSENVKSLAKRAATYWGLDVDKVFFLDRDGRIVFEDMSLREIILPPMRHQPLAPSNASSSGALENGPSGGGHRESDIAKYSGGGDDEGTDPAMEQYTVKGRNYNLTLVRAVRPGDVPTNATVNKPKGEEWQDFTFDQKKLAQDLKDTLAKYGDPEFEEQKIEMDEIPSLYDLIESGKKKKQEKRADTACRAAEFSIFFVCFCMFHYLLLPSYNWSVTMRLIADGIEQELDEFNLGERAYLGVNSYEDIATEPQFQAWVQGPLKRSAILQGLTSHNLYVVSLKGLKYTAEPQEVLPPVEWCPSPSPPGELGLDPTMLLDPNFTNETNDSNGSNATNDTEGGLSTTPAPAPPLAGCSPVSLMTCRNTRVVDVYTTAMEDNDLVPQCKMLFRKNPFLLWLNSLTDSSEFSYVTGEVSSYFGGQETVVGLQNVSTFDSSVATMNVAVDDTSTPARMFIVVVYSPSLSGLFVYQFLVEATRAGRLFATRKLVVINLGLQHEASFSISTSCILLAAMAFGMEVRRIMGCPKRCTFEQRRERCSIWTFIFLLMPLAMLLSFSVFAARFVTATSDGIMVLDPTTNTLTNQSFDNLYKLYSLDYYYRLINLAVLVFQNLLLFRYLLMYFPHLSFLTAMVTKLMTPLWYVLVFLLTAFVAFGCTLYVMYSAQQGDFRNFIVTLAQTIKFAQGGVNSWYKLYAEYPTLYTVVHMIGFTVIQLMLNNMALAVMLSHKKEKDLRQNYSYHRFWAAEISKKANGKEEFNPATIGEKLDAFKDQAK